VGRVVALCAAAIAAAVGFSGCGSGGGTSSEGNSPGAAARPGSAGAILDRPGKDYALTLGSSDFARGENRVVFLVLDQHGKAIERPTARVWVARSLGAKPIVRTTAMLENVGVPGTSEAAVGDVTHVFVTRFRAPAAGKYVLVAEPVGGRPVQGATDLKVRDEPLAPAVGSKAFPSRTPTIASTGGDFAALTTSNPPDKGLLRYSVADSLAAHVPFVVAFATPAFCTSRLCGPAVDVVDYVRRHLGTTDVRFIHVEIYKDNQPPDTNRWVREWKLPTEPWIFLVGRDGRIKERFEGAVSARELDAAVRKYLLK
jgi:hypothetical protein